MTENKFQTVIDNMVDKMIIEYHQCSKSYAVPAFTDHTVLAEQTQNNDEDATQKLFQDN